MTRPSPWWPPRVLHVIDSLALGGAERMAVELANAAHARGWAAAVLASRFTGPLARRLCEGVQCWCLGRVARFDIRAIPRLRGIEKEFAPTLLHIHGFSSAYLVAVARLLGILRVPALLHDHFGEIHTVNRPSPFKHLAVGWSVQRIVGVSRANSEWALSSGFPKAKVATIPNALDVDAIRRTQPADLHEQIGRPVPRPCGVVVGRLYPQKGIRTLLEAAAHLPTEKPWSLAIVGGGAETPYGRECIARVHDLGLAERVFFVGPVAEAVALAKACDFAVIASHSESGPLVLIEYLASEIPVIATDVGENTRMAKEAGAIRCVPPANAAALSLALEEMIALTREERAAKGRRGWEVARELFDMAQVFPRWEDVYREVVTA